TEFTMRRLLAALAGSTAQLRRWGLRNPYAQISFRAPGLDTNGLSLGMRYRPLSLIVLVETCSYGSGIIRRTLPSSVSSRCGLLRNGVFDSPAGLPPRPI